MIATGVCTPQAITRSSPSDAETDNLPRWDNASTHECVSPRGQTASASAGGRDCVTAPQPLAGELSACADGASSLHGLLSDLSPVPVRPTATISEAGAYRFRLKDPIDVRVSRLGGRVALGFLHELGHLLDHQVFYDRKTRTWASAMHVAFTSWRTAAARMERRPLPGGRHRQRYFNATHEVVGALLRADGVAAFRRSAARRQLTNLQAEDDPHVWPAVQFEPVAVEVERVFARLGLTQLTLPLPEASLAMPTAALGALLCFELARLRGRFVRRVRVILEAVLLTIARLAARTSSSRFTGRPCGASLRTFGILRGFARNREHRVGECIERFLASVSVGSIIRASGTTSGK
jgi:hypothetical protein